MAITLSKAIEIIELNIKDAAKHMPPDCRDSLKLLIALAKREQILRTEPTYTGEGLLPDEAPEPPARFPL